MAEVLSRTHDDQSYYSGSSLKRSGPSRTSLFVGSPSTATIRTSTSEPSFENIERLSRSLHSSASASTRQSFSDFSQATSYASTPASTFSFDHTSDDDDQDDDDEGIAFPAYDEVRFFHEDEPLDLPPSPRPEEEDASDTSHDSTSVVDSTRSDSPLPTPSVADDIAIKQEPSRHVDYLSHNWREEDIWSSWRHIVSQRNVYGQRSRLENASWRTWAKSKYKLATVTPETLNWLKESDVTWLYGPLQPATTHPITQQALEPTSQLSQHNSFVAKKPILKKRSVSEAMLQRSISTSSLLKQAAASVQAQAQQPGPVRRPVIARASSAYASPGGLTVPQSRDHLDFLDLDYFSPRPSSGSETPFDNPKRHIRFDNKVEQCIAVDCKDADYDDDDDESGAVDHPQSDDSDSNSSSEDGIVMMRKPKRKHVVRKESSRNGSASGKTIEKLPDTTLKCKAEETQASEHPPTPFAMSWNSTKLSPSPSQETIRAVSPSRNYLLPPDDDDDDAEDEAWRSNTLSNRRDSVAIHRIRTGDASSIAAEDEESELRRSNSGIFMPYEEDEDDMVAAGLFGKVSDTINTAKDIAHVIWNVGWRK